MAVRFPIAAWIGKWGFKNLMNRLQSDPDRYIPKVAFELHRTKSIPYAYSLVRMLTRLGAKIIDSSDVLQVMLTARGDGERVLTVFDSLISIEDALFKVSLRATEIEVRILCSTKTKTG